MTIGWIIYKYLARGPVNTPGMDEKISNDKSKEKKSNSMDIQEGDFEEIE